MLTDSIGQPVRASVFTSSYRGGASWFVLELAAGMAAAGGDILLIAPMAEPESHEAKVAATRRIRLPRGAYGKGSKPVRAMRTLMRIVASFAAFARARLHSRVFVISFYDWLSVMVLQQLWIRLMGGQLIYVVHDAKPHAWTSSPMLRWVERALLRLTYRIPQQLVTLTEAARTQVIDEFGRRGPVTVIPHGAYVKTGTKPLPGNRRLLLFGAIRRNKRVIEAIEGMKQAVAEGIRGVHLTIAGAPHNDDPGYWLDCAERLIGTESYIDTEIGFVEEPRLAVLFERSDALILPYEEFNSQSGVAVLAACSQRLLLCTDCGGLAELREQGLEPFTIERPVTASSVANAIQRFADTPIETLRDQAARSKQSLDTYLAWDRIGAEYLKLSLLKNISTPCRS